MVNFLSSSKKKSTYNPLSDFAISALLMMLRNIFDEFSTFDVSFVRIFCEYFFLSKFLNMTFYGDQFLQQKPRQDISIYLGSARVVWIS